MAGQGCRGPVADRLRQDRRLCHSGHRKGGSAQRAVQVLILCPTRELAVQVSEEVHKLALFKRGIHALPIYGGQSYERQFWGLKQGAQIVIGTPGRVMDHMRRGTLRFDNVKMAILDEADVMLDMGFRDDIELILQAVPKERQTVFFSATMPRPIQRPDREIRARTGAGAHRAEGDDGSDGGTGVLTKWIAASKSNCSRG
jgi:superfamily II DNA/RNA helicase